MNNEDLDNLARSMASGLSRRQSLKLLGMGLAGGLLGLFGRRATSAQPALADTTGSQTVYLPMIAAAPCTTPSTCGERQYCSADEKCICIRTPEGDIRCGQIPSTCNVQRCNSSADCANLGSGYFCDTPDSGCCDDQSQGYCIAPCGASTPTCPPAQVCGSACCNAGESCINGACCPASSVCGSACCNAGESCVGGACCPAERVCGAVCCPSGQICQNNQCVPDLSSDVATMESIDAARVALAGGATQVALSPGGRLQYSRTLSNGTVTSEEMRDQGVVVMRWTIGDPQSVGEDDADKDGFFERRSVVTKGATAEEWQVVITHYDPATQQPTEQQTQTRSGGATIDIVVEQADDTGALQKVNEYSVPLESITLLKSNGTLAAARPSATCSAADCDPAAIRQKFNDAVNRGLQCLHNKGATDFENRITRSLFRYPEPINFACASLGTHGGQTVLASTTLPFPYPLDLLPNATIEINQDAFCNLSPDQQLQTLFHEATHLDDELSRHDPNREVAPNRNGVDRSYACGALCFNPPGAVSQCTCATCLGTTKCDARCATSLGYQTCPDDFGAWCPCLSRLRWYPSCSDCLAGCTGSLGCFGINYCVPVNKGLCAPTTCSR
ncbi:MAG TPA: hypothetical protein VFT66_15310 [Roseiflexaceae bacterium]|nr:hypothetical protein [Roseiflexaceae bacterium]